MDRTRLARMLLAKDIVLVLIRSLPAHFQVSLAIITAPFAGTRTEAV
jgi:hypothetical protein